VYESLVTQGLRAGGAPKAQYAVSLWCNACSCPYTGVLCKHILFLRIFYLLEQKRKRRLWSDEEERLYAVFHSRREFDSRARAPPIIRDRVEVPRAASSVVAEVDYVTAELAHLFAVASERLLCGERVGPVLDTALVSVRAAAKALRAAVGAVEVVRGASGASAKKPEIARSPDVIADAQGRAVPITVRELPPSESLQRTLTRAPLQADGVDAGIGGSMDVEPPSSLETSQVAARAHVVMARVTAMLEVGGGVVGAVGGALIGAGAGAGCQQCGARAGTRCGCDEGGAGGGYGAGTAAVVGTDDSGGGSARKRVRGGR
jgi:hypothetical protein